MPYSKTDRLRIHRRAKAKVGLLNKQDGTDYNDFMDQCISDQMDSGDCGDEDDAREACQTMWDEDGGDGS